MEISRTQFPSNGLAISMIIYPDAPAVNECGSDFIDMIKLFLWIICAVNRWVWLDVLCTFSFARNTLPAGMLPMWAGEGDVANVGRGGGYTKGLGHWVGNSAWKE